MNYKKRAWLYAALVAAILVVDQVVKILVKTNMHIGEDIPLIGEWCRLHFIENEGFAFGMHFGGTPGKVFLTIFRLAATLLVGWYILRQLKRGGRASIIGSVSLIFAGAVGNLIDCCFYGRIFSASYYDVAVLFPPEGGYAPLLQGKVVDMFYFPLFEFNWPDWMPLIGGEHFLFFSAIFNVADAAITIGAIWLLIVLVFFSPKEEKEEVDEKNKFLKWLKINFDI